MGEKIKILIVDDVQDIRENICKLLEFHSEVTVIGQAATAVEAIEKAKQTQPDVILMDINMPGMDGITATEIISVEVPSTNIIMMSVQGEEEYLRRAMIAGAKHYLIKPFAGDELIHAIKQICRDRSKNEMKNPEKGKIITVFSTKGGVGKTAITTNLAAALANRLGARVGIIDADLQFGDVTLFLNIVPQVTIFDLVRDIDQLDPSLLEKYLTDYNDKVKVLAAPLRPEQAGFITGKHLAMILKTMSHMFDYIIIDTPPVFNETVLCSLDAADCILVLASLDLPSIKNVKLCLEIMESLNYSSERIKVVLNRENSEGGIQTHEVEENLHYEFIATLPSDGKTVLGSVNRGIPFVMSHPETLIAQKVLKLAMVIANVELDFPLASVGSEGVVSRMKQLFC
ncbi:CpaE family protein [Pelosinus sp. sgz500959]|uniref:AAA family ATPase n=1 Tax=Pelosinus sp. sgz500959 TaxID=3242472 RepID=UPI00366AD34F